MPTYTNPSLLRLPKTLILVSVRGTKAEIKAASKTAPKKKSSKESATTDQLLTDALKPVKKVSLRKKRGEEEPILQLQAKEMMKYMKRSLKYYEFGDSRVVQGERSKEEEEEEVERLIEERVRVEGVVGEEEDGIVKNWGHEGGLFGTNVAGEVTKPVNA